MKRKPFVDAISPMPGPRSPMTPSKPATSATDKPDGQRFVAQLAVIFGFVLHPFLRGQYRDVVDALNAFLQQGAKQQSRVRGAEAEVRAEAERHMRIRLAVETHFAGGFKGGFVLIG